MTTSRPPVYPPVVTMPPEQPSDPRRMTRLLDLRHKAPRAQKRSKRRLGVGPTVMRDPATVDGIVLHQAAVQWGARPEHRREAEGDERLAIALRVVEDVPAHAVAMQSGDVILRSPLAAYLYHANGLNGRSLGVEVEGLYDGVEVVGAHPPPTPRTITAARRAVVELVLRGRELGMPIRYIWAHRQSSPARRADPGSVIWREVGLWAVDALDLETQPRETWVSRGRPGRPIPEAWGGPLGVAY